MKKLFIFVVSLFVCVGALQTRVMADDDVDPFYDPSKPTDVSPVSDDLAYPEGTPNPYIINYNFQNPGKKLPASYLQADNTYQKIWSPALDSVYDSYNSLANKPRSNFAISWAEAVCEAAELRYNTYKNNGADVDLSEMHLAWFSYNNKSVEDSLNLVTNSGVSTSKVGTDVFNIGGSPEMATLALANGIGFVTEDKFPQKQTYSDTELSSYTSSDKTYQPDYILKSSEWYTLKTEKDMQRVKEAITTKGPLAVTIHLSDSWLRAKKPMGPGYDEIDAKNCIFMTEELAEDLQESTEANYGALLVGWKDDFEVNNFNIDLINTFNFNKENVPGQDYTFFDVHNQPVYWKTKHDCQPKKDGAWYVKVNVKGDECIYYYVSYEDVTISNSLAASFEIEKAPIDTINTYQFDGNSGFNYYEVNGNEATFYNVYTPQNKEYIDSIGLFTYQKNIQYEVNVFAGDMEQNPLSEIFEDNFACIKKSGTLTNPGFHKIDLRGVTTNGFYNSIDYAGYQNQNLYAIVKYKTTDGTNVLVPVDGESKSCGSFVESLSAKNDSSSILVAANGNKDLVTLAGAPAKIKLYTHPISNKITYKNVPSDATNPNTRLFYTDYEETDFIKPLEKEGYEFYGWFTNSNLASETLLTMTPRVVNGDLDLYPAFKQRIVFDYGDEEGYEEANKNKKIIVNVSKYDSNGNAQNFEVPTNTINNGTKEFMGWGLIDKNGNVVTSNNEPVITIGLADYVYKFDNGKLNGADIVLKPIWKTITSTIDLPGQTQEEIQKLYDEMEKGQVQYIAPGEGQVVSVVSDSLNGAVDAKEDQKVLLWFESVEISKSNQDDENEKTEFNSFKEAFESKLEKIESGAIKKVTISKLVNINLFAQEESETEGTKVPVLKKKIELEYDLSGDENKELREAAEKGILRVSQMHNGKVIEIDPQDVTYDKANQKIKFKTNQFSIFAFGIAQSTPATEPEGETNPTGGDTTKTSDNKQEDTNTNTGTNTNTNNNQNNSNTNTPNPEFKTPNTGIY